MVQKTRMFKKKSPLSFFVEWSGGVLPKCFIMAPYPLLTQSCRILEWMGIKLTLKAFFTEEWYWLSLFPQHIYACVCVFQVSIFKILLSYAQHLQEVVAGIKFPGTSNNAQHIINIGKTH